MNAYEVASLAIFLMVSVAVILSILIWEAEDEA